MKDSIKLDTVCFNPGGLASLFIHSNRQCGTVSLQNHNNKASNGLASIMILPLAMHR